VVVLLNSGAELNLVTCDGWTAMTLAAEKGHHDIVELLRAAADRGC
jgi:ankyrin repeat protein